MSAAIDLIIMGDYVVSMDDSASVYENGAVAVDDGLILAVGPADEITAEYSAAETLAGEHRIVMPGLINGHSHAAMTLLRGVADDLALMDWLNNYISCSHRHRARVLGNDSRRHDYFRRHVLLPGRRRGRCRALRHACAYLRDRD